MSTSILRRSFAVALLVGLLLSLTLPVLATAESDTTEQAPAETVGETPAPADLPEPAVPIEPAPEEEPTPEWTFRFLVPTSLLIGGLAVIGTTIAYFVKVAKARYRVVS